MRALVLLLALLALPAAATAQDGRVSGPVIPKGKGEQCVAETDYMRRFHMTELTHQRDETTQRGVRTKRFSLKECVACHATSDSGGRPISINAPGQFCASCHEYAAVTIDCFQCHATKPEDGGQARLPAPLQMTAAAEPEAAQ
jgi:hypothetical protein